jgi:hypothetical protein
MATGCLPKKGVTEAEFVESLFEETRRKRRAERAEAEAARGRRQLPAVHTKGRRRA